MKGVMTMASGFLLQFINGAQFSVGSISMYIYSYFPEATFSQTQAIFPMMMIIAPVSNFVATQLVNRGCSTRLLMFIGAALNIGGLMVAAELTSFAWFQLVFAFGFGVSGFIYSLVLQQGWLYFPGREGVVSGVIIAGFGIGGFIANELAQVWINPKNIEPVSFDHSVSTSKPFPFEIASNVPSMLWKLSLYMSVITLLSLALFQKYQGPKVQSEQPETQLSC